jgi:hypothetical protein
MTETATALAAPDLAAGVPISDVGDGTMLVGHVSEKYECTMRYSRGGKKLAVALVRRDLDGLLAEVEIDKAIRADELFVTR